ncbi:GrpB family protein [Paenalcaligenes sp. Me52]|uniref:GrpB family protein n=1 Tax=Paenalcaligenes sp. Me52 TaxID=3392038 RepID=UPI003D268095
MLREIVNVDDLTRRTWTQHDKYSITTFADGDPNENPWVAGKPQIEKMEVLAYDPAWALRYQYEHDRIQQALGDKALSIVHVGSTAVPELPAKPVIDIDVLVADPADEDSYVPALTQLGYQLTIREPSWYQHRMLRHESPRVNLHIFAPGCPEHIRHVLFRDWLCNHEADRKRYAASKFNAAGGTNNALDYNRSKHAVVHAIYQDMFAAHGLL